MPELAEVEFNRKQWDAGLRQKVLRVELHPGKRVFRGTSLEAIKRGLTGAIYLGSVAHGKQMLLRFSGGAWLGLHLGMTGRLRAGLPAEKTTKHDHLVLVLSRASLVFADPRQFGRVRFHQGSQAPEWWRRLPPAVTSTGFTVQRMRSFLRRHGRLATKAALLLQ
jgi:formamidopyrimidine-DNA glycosylase